MPKLTISFKNTKEDIELYEEICRHSDKSAYIKDKLRSLRNDNISISRKEVKVEVEKSEESADDILMQLSGIGIS